MDAPAVPRFPSGARARRSLTTIRNAAEPLEARMRHPRRERERRSKGCARPARVALLATRPAEPLILLSGLSANIGHALCDTTRHSCCSERVPFCVRVLDEKRGPGEFD
ncbi:hypothetical protein MTO96_001445 [Rhipicephalus appendiculatus]